MKKTIWAVLIFGGALTTYNYYGHRTIDFVPNVSTVMVTEGDIVDTVGATGTLEAVTTVQVGSQVSGIIQELNVDFNSIVREGDVIARLDPSLFDTQIEQSRANLLRAEADVERLRVTADDAVIQLARSEDLASRELISETELEAAQVSVRSAKAQVKSAEAQVTQANASLNQNEVNLEHTVIRTPIDGIVISRLVDIGQTVAASFQAPELFAIAADLTKMRVIANIDESDVGRIRPNQRATFSVDAFPDEGFEGTVTQVRLEPVIQQNVVTYATVIDAPNAELKLKPGMTATVTVEIARRNNVTRIPNAALRFNPTPSMFTALKQAVPAELRQAENSVTTTSRESENPSHSNRLENSPDDPQDLASGINTERRRQIMERVESMSREERQEFFERRRAQRGFGSDRTERTASERRREPKNDSSLAAVRRGATTIDALFSPLKTPESLARIWIWNGNRLSSVNIRLGVTDGTSSELLSITGNEPVAPLPVKVSISPTVEALRQQLATIESTSARAALQTQLELLENSGNQSQTGSSTLSTSLTVGTELVTHISTPDRGADQSAGRPLSPLIPQFPFGRRSNTNRR